MPIKFSSLTTKGIANTVKLVGLYNDNTSETGVSNCLVNVSDFAKKTELNNLDNSTVHKTGTEEISGTKTFTAKDVILKNSAIDITDISTASSGSYEHISVKDVNNKEFGHFKSIFNNGKITTEIASNPNGGLDNFKSISVTVDTTTGVTTTSCPPPTETTSGTTTQIATAGWVNSTSVGNNVVHKSGTETITGTKTFKVHTYIKNDDVEQMTNPSSNSEKLFIFTDSNDVRIGSVGTSMTTDGYSRAYISASKKINGSNKYCSINAYIDKEGNTCTSAPTPAKNDNSTKIATTAWMNNFDYVVEWKQPSESDPSWYRVYKSGWKEQGTTILLNNGDSWTFPKSFSNTGYTIISSPYKAPTSRPSDNNWIAYPLLKSKASCQFKVWDSDDSSSRSGYVMIHAMGY